MSDKIDNEKENTNSTGEKSFISNFFEKHKIDIAIYLSAAAIVISFAVHGALTSEKNKDSDIKYNYNYNDNAETDAAEAAAAVVTEKNSVSDKQSFDGTSRKADKKATTSVKTTTVSSKPDKVETVVSHTVFPVDINLVTYEQLLEINGIGETLASNIIAYRNRVGKIHDMAQLIEVDGIGERRIEMLRAYLYVSDADYIPYNSSYPDDNATTTTRAPNDPSPEDTQHTDRPSDDTASETPTTQTTVGTTEPVEEEPHYSYVHINSADADELVRCLLITQEQAEAIIALREQILYFSSADELILTDMFTIREIEAIREYILFD